VLAKRPYGFAKPREGAKIVFGAPSDFGQRG
jgi:hypothetical protein